MEMLSVIVPVYNAEKYLNRCIESILKQSYELIEVILIDDGSTDSSGSICDRYGAEDARVRVVHQKNKGLVATRKVGVNLAKGNFVAFVDADDWIELDMYTEMMAKLMCCSADIVTSGIVVDFKDKQVIIKDDFKEGLYDYDAIRHNIIPVMMFSEAQIWHQGITASLWNKIFRKQLIVEELNKMDDSITYGEDGAVVYPLMCRCEQIYIMSKSWYHYVQYDNSMIHKYSTKSVEQIKLLQNYMVKRFADMGLLSIVNEQLNMYIKSFINNFVRDIYAFPAVEVFYLFPYEVIPKGCRIIIYGAGVVGRCYYKALKSAEYVEVVAWIDKEEKIVDGIKTEKVSALNEIEYDYIVIAVQDEMVVAEIKELLSKYIVDEDKVIWTKPRRVI